jgi:protein-S-isoprenylcysteine O-methyltransferase Ste14
MEAWWNDPLSDTGVAKAKEEKHELRIDKAGLLMEAAEADPATARFNRPLLPSGHEIKRFQLPGHLGRQLSREPIGGGKENHPVSAIAYQIILALVAGAALIRSIGILLLKVRQLRYRRRAVTKPTAWQDLCTEPEPPLLGIVALVLLVSLPEAAPSREASVLAFAGLLFAIAGWGLIAWAVHAFPALSPGHYILPEQQIVTAGPYGHLRHPLYTGALLIWVSLSLAFSSGVILGITLLYVLPAYLVYMRSEERMLLAHFGEPYARYRDRVGMLFPRLGSRRSRTSRPTRR